MSNTVIQIKRSTANGAPLLQPGELAYTSNGEILFVGSPVGSDTANTIAIGGKRTPGTLTANQALVANNSSWIDNIQTAKLILGPVGTTVNVATINATANATVLGAASNNELTTTWAIKTYVDEKITQTGAASDLNGLSDVTLITPANNQLLVYDGTAQQWENHSIGGTANEVEVTFSGQDITVGLPSAVELTTSLTVGTSVINTTAVSATNLSGNGASITSVNAATVGGNTAGDLIAYANAAYTNATAFAANADNISSGTLNTARLPATANVTTAINVGAEVNINTTSIAIGNSTVNTTITASGISIDGTLGTGNTTITGTLAANDTTITGTANVSGTINVGSNVSINTSFISVGNSTVNTQISAGNLALNGSELLIGNSTTNTVLTGEFIDLTGYIEAGQYISIGNTSVNTYANSTTLVTADVDTVTLTATGNTIVGGNFTANGNVILGDSTSDNVSVVGHVNTSILPAANVTYDLGSQNLQWNTIHANNAHVDYIQVDHDVTVAGNLTVTGSLVTINVSTLAVTDSLIHLATNNTISDTLDIGFFGNYQVGGGDHEHTGLFRDATDGVYKLFQGLTVAPTTTVDTSNNTFSLATLEAYLISGGFISNTSAISITANSTVNVAIVANTLSLSTPLGLSSGGLGVSSLTANSILTANSTGGLAFTTSTTQGHVLQINNGAPVFGHLDGGTF